MRANADAEKLGFTQKPGSFDGSALGEHAFQPGRRSTIEVPLIISEAPHLRSSIIPHPNTDYSINRIASR